MTIDRPMFPPRAESVDSFSAPTATGQRETENRTSDSPRPAERNIIAFPSGPRPATALPLGTVAKIQRLPYGVIQDIVTLVDLLCVMIAQPDADTALVGMHRVMLIISDRAHALRVRLEGRR